MSVEAGPIGTGAAVAGPALSIVIPIYNFRAFIGETLDSILAQDRADEVEIVVADGASTDGTPDLMAERYAAVPNLRYVRFPEKGGIDRDMAKAVSLARAPYVWLFMGDDVMRPGGIATVLDAIRSGSDVLIGKHDECDRHLDVLFDYPVLRPDVPDTFDLHDPADRARYFAAAVNTEAFFSFSGSLTFKKATWDRVEFDERFAGSCWAHVARFFALSLDELRVTFLARTLLARRGDNDSFSTGGVVKRCALSIDGYHRLADTFFGHDSLEAFHVRRAVRREFHAHGVAGLAVLCARRPGVEDRALLDRLVAKAYADPSWRNRLVKALYRLPPHVFHAVMGALAQVTMAASRASGGLRRLIDRRP